MNVKNINYLDYSAISSHYDELEKENPLNLVEEYIQALALNFINESVYRENLL